MSDDTDSCSLTPLINTDRARSSSITTTSDHELSVKEKLRECFKLRYQPRTIKSKGALIMLIWSFLMSATYFYASHMASMIHHTDSLLNVIQLFMGLTIPLAGWLADVRFGRYKVIRFCIGIMWISSLLLTATCIILQYLEVHTVRLHEIFLIFLVPLGMGFCGFQVNIANPVWCGSTL